MKLFGAVLFMTITLTWGQGIPHSCGIEKIMEATALLTQTIKDTPFPVDDNGFFATVCDFYQRYLDYIDVASVTCTDNFLNALRAVARVGGFYHRLANRCPLSHPLKSDNANIDHEHVYEVLHSDKLTCGSNLRGDDNCVKDWVNGIKDGANTCSIFRAGIICHRNWHEENCKGLSTSSAITKAKEDLNDALKVLMPLQPEQEACENMTP